jgi:hypothetical protein
VLLDEAHGVEQYLPSYESEEEEDEGGFGSDECLGRRDRELADYCSSQPSRLVTLCFKCFMWML